MLWYIMIGLTNILLPACPVKPESKVKTEEKKKGTIKMLSD